MVEFNVKKDSILFLMRSLGRTVEAKDLVYSLGISPGNAYQRLWKMWKQRYLIKRKWGRYSLGVKGKRVLDRLEKRIEIQRVTGMDISLNLKRPVPFEALRLYKDFTAPSPISFPNLR